MFGLTPYNRRRNGIQRDCRSVFDIPSMIESFFNDSYFPAYFTNSAQMKVDIKENDKEYVIEAELPGVNKNDIVLEVGDNRLNISVQKNEIIEENKDSYIRKERRSSSMSRSFWIDDVKEDQIKAEFNNGLLTVTLPKSEESKDRVRKIDIN